MWKGWGSDSVPKAFIVQDWGSVFNTRTAQKCMNKQAGGCSGWL